MANDFAINIVATGAAAAAAEIRRVPRAAEDASRAVERTGESAEDTARRLEGMGDAGRAGLGEVENAADGAGGALEDTSQSAATLTDNLGRVRNAGLAMAAIGAVGMTIANNFIQVAEEGEAVEARLKSLLEAQGRLQDMDSINAVVQDVTIKGHFDDDDSIRDAAVHMASFGVETEHINTLLPRAAQQARTMGIEVAGVADGLGKAYSDMNLAPLKRSGLAFTETEIAAVKAAKGVSDVAGRMKFMEVVTAAVDRNTVSLENSLTDTQAAANDAARAMDDAMTSAGTGAAAAKAHVDTLIASVLGVGNASSGVLEGAGYFGYFGSMALAAGGSVLAVGAQIGMLTLAFPGLGVSALAAFTTMKAAAASTIPFLVGVASALAVPFAILAAGVAVGVAGYEALRAANIGGYGDTHKSTAEIFADTRKMMMGDPAADAKAATEKAISGAPAMPGAAALGAMVGAPTAPATDASAALGAALGAVGGANASAGKTATAAAKAAAALERDKKKVQTAREKLLSDRARDNADILIAQLDAQTELQIKQIEAVGGDDAKGKVAAIKAAQTRKKAAIQAKAESDPAARSKMLKLADIAAKSTMDLAAIPDATRNTGNTGKPAALSLAQILSKYRQPRRDNVATLGNNTFYGPNAANALGMIPGATAPLAGSGRSGAQKLVARVKSTGYDAKGMFVEFEKIMLPNSYGDAAGAM